MRIADLLQERFEHSPAARLDDLAPPEGLSVDELTADLPQENAAGLALALILLRHGQLDAAHSLAQRIAGQDGDFVHALMHRMEGDLGNACHWHARHGPHPVHDRIAVAIRTGALPRPPCLDPQHYEADSLTRALRDGSDAADLLPLHQAEIAELFAHLIDRLSQGGPPPTTQGLPS